MQLNKSTSFVANCLSWCSISFCKLKISMGMYVFINTCSNMTVRVLVLVPNCCTGRTRTKTQQPLNSYSYCVARCAMNTRRSRKRRRPRFAKILPPKPEKPQILTKTMWVTCSTMPYVHCTRYPVAYPFQRGRPPGGGDGMGVAGAGCRGYWRHIAQKYKRFDFVAKLLR